MNAETNKKEIAVVVGTAGAFGRAIVKRLLDARLTVIAVGRSKQSLDELASAHPGVRPCVAELGSHWTIDNLIVDLKSRHAVIEWTHFKTRHGLMLRGDEWYRFGETGRIQEIRAYYACPAADGVAAHGLGGFDYSGRGYPMKVPNP